MTCTPGNRISSLSLQWGAQFDTNKGASVGLRSWDVADVPVAQGSMLQAAKNTGRPNPPEGAESSIRI